MKIPVAAALALASSLATYHASAFCGFYVGGADAKLFNNATEVVLMREGTRTVLSMQNNYEGPPSNFAMVVPVPVVLQKENVKTLPKDVFAKIDALSAPRLVEYWEQDPCAPPVLYDSMPTTVASAPGGGGPKSSADMGVKIEAQFSVGEYDIVILSAKDSGGLDAWLRQQKYAIPPGAEPLKPYVQSGSKFFVAKVDASKVTFEKGMAQLSPLRFHYDSETFTLPVRLGLMNAKGPQDLIVNILARGQRYEVSNYPNATIPTNYDVSENAKNSFGTFYAELFDETLKHHPKAVVTEYSWDASSCNPCPGPALSPQDIVTFGADALAPTPPVVPVRPGGATAPKAPKAPPSPPRPGGPVGPGGGPRMGINPWGFTVTRLHARYTKESLGDDLVFRAAPPIVGGREFMQAEGKLEHGAQPGPMNNFQGRYAVRHPWTGPVACESPRRGIWGGPPNAGNPQPLAAKDTAFAPRGSVPLATFLRSNVSELNLAAAGAPVSGVGAAAPAATVTVPAAVPTTEPTGPAGPPAVEAGGGGCAGCSTSSSSNTFAWIFGLAFIAAVIGRKKS